MKQSKLTSWSTNKSTTSNTTSTTSQAVVEILDDVGDDDILLAAGIDHNPCASPHPSSSQRNNHTPVEIIPGFDMDAGNNWVYPINYPVRDYQYNITQKALFSNTLVTLPTGLGKTFIAAVVMYNYYRWYPNGKIVFMAPTKPLVAQQEQACYDVVGISRDTTIRLTGTMNPNKRRHVWQSKRVFFLTPQVLQNDLNRDTCCAKDIVCLVVDEAHRALGNHAYCQVIKGLCNYTRDFRVLALSATPGDDIQNVQKVITNLLISHVEIRSEESFDIRPYIHKRNIEKIVVPLSEELLAIKVKFLKILGDVIQRLFRQQVLYSNQVERLSKYQILKAREQFRNKTSGFSAQRGSIEGDFALSISLYHAYELLLQQGMKSFYQFAKGIVDSSKSTARVRGDLATNRNFIDIMEELNFKFNRSHNSQLTPKSKATNIQFLLSSHPKLSKLKDIVVEHFENFVPPNDAGQSLKTRIMIFAQYRDSVLEITDLLQHYSPTVKVMSFTGQATSAGKNSRGLSQKEQLKVIQNFRRGGYNTLVSTCVGEEGLDIGDVDLIICYDSNASPIRLVQRMGRTGRKRRGRVVLLVTEGKEDQIQSKTESKKKSIHRAIRDSINSFQLYQHNPRMVPAHLKPQPYKTKLTVDKVDADEQDTLASACSSDSILSYMKKGSSGKGASKKNAWYLSNEEFKYWRDNFKLPSSSNSQSYTISFDDLPHYSSYEKVLLPHHRIEHSQRTKNMIEIASFCDALSHNHSMIESYEIEMTAFLDKSDVKADIDLNRNEHCDGRFKQHTVEEFVTTKSSINKGYRSQSKRIRRNKFTRFLDDDTSDSDGNNSQDTTDKGKSTTTYSKSMKMAGSQLPVLHSDTDDNGDESHGCDIKENRVLSNSDDDCYINEKVNNVKDNKSVSELLNQPKSVLTEVTNYNKDQVNLKYDVDNTKINSDNNLFKELQMNDEMGDAENDISDELMSSLPEVEFISKKQEVSDVQEFEKDDDIIICPPPEIDYVLLNKIGDGHEEGFKDLETTETESKLKSPCRSVNQVDTTKNLPKDHQTVTPNSCRSINQIDTTKISPKTHQTVTPIKGGNNSTINLFDDEIDDSLLLYATESDCYPCTRNVTSNHSNRQIIKESEKEQDPIPPPVTNKASQKQNFKTDQISRPSMKLTSQHTHSNNEIEKSKSLSNRATLSTAEDDDAVILSVTTPQLSKSVRAPKKAYRNNNKPLAKNFIDDEAEVSSQDIDQFDSDEYEYEVSGPINDSFINDSSQPTPICTKPSDVSPGSMLAVYQKSLFSPNIGRGKINKLKFHASHRLATVLNKENNNSLPTPVKVKDCFYNRNNDNIKTGSDCSSDYEFDSFCVENEDEAIEYLTQPENLLDDLEHKLGKRNRKTARRRIYDSEDDVIVDNAESVETSSEMNIDELVDRHNASKESVHSDVNNGMCIGAKRGRKRKHVLDESLSSIEDNIDNCIPVSNKKGLNSMESSESSKPCKLNEIKEDAVSRYDNDQEIGNFNLDINDWIDDDDVLAMIDSNEGVPINAVNTINPRSMSTPLHQENIDKAVPNFHLGIDMPSLDNVKALNHNKEVTEKKSTANFQNVSMKKEVSTNTMLMPKPNVKDLEAQNSAISLTSDAKKTNNELSVLIDTRELSSSSQTITTLRFKHHIKTEICSLKCCSYVLSTRMGVERQLLSSLMGGCNDRFVDRIRHMCGLYDRPCLIVEKDRSKVLDDAKTTIQGITKYLCSTYTSLALSRVKLLFSESQEHTANILVQLAVIESKKNFKIDFPLKPPTEREHLFKVMMSIPSVSYILALNICVKFKSLTEIIDMAPKELEKSFSKVITLSRAESIHSHFSHSYNPILQGLKSMHKSTNRKG